MKLSMASLNFTDPRGKLGLLTVGRLSNHSQFDGATKHAVKRRLGFAPLTGVGVLTAVDSKFSADEFQEVQTKLQKNSAAVVQQLRAQEELLVRGQLL